MRESCVLQHKEAAQASKHAASLTSMSMKPFNASSQLGQQYVHGATEHASSVQPLHYYKHSKEEEWVKQHTEITYYEMVECKHRGTDAGPRQRRDHRLNTHPG